MLLWIYFSFNSFFIWWWQPALAEKFLHVSVGKHGWKSSLLAFSIRPKFKTTLKQIRTNAIRYLVRTKDHFNLVIFMTIFINTLNLLLKLIWHNKLVPVKQMGWDSPMLNFATSVLFFFNPFYVRPWYFSILLKPSLVN